MRRFPPVLWAALISLFITASFLTSCGGGDSTSGAVVTVALTSGGFTSLTQGDVSVVVGTAVDSSGNSVSTAKITYNSSNTNVITVSPNGAVCAGIWDSSFVVCTPGQVGSAQIIASADGINSSGITYTSHQKITSIKLIAPSSNCVSSGQTLQLAVQAFNGTTDVTSSVGTLTWQTSSATVASVNSSGVITAASPGTTNVFVSAGSITSPAQTFKTCAVQSISLHVQSAADKTFSIAAAATQVLVADVVDTNGNAITGAALQFNSSQLAVATTAAGSPVTNVTITGVGAGTSTIVASCTPPNCNTGFLPIYSNPVSANITGTSSSTVYVTGTGASTIIPIPTGTNVAGTAITLPAQPTSFLFNSAGTTGYLGSASGLMFLNTSTATVTSTSSAPGSVLAIAPDGGTLAVANPANGTVALYNTTSNAVTATLFVPGTAPRAAFSVDSNRVFIVSDNVLYVYSPPNPLQTFSLTSPAKDVAFLAQGSFGYLAGGSANTVTTRATCDFSQVDIIPTPGATQQITAIPDGSGMLAVDPPNIEVIKASTTGAGCPPGLSDALTTKNTGQGSFAQRQIITLTNSTKAYLLTDRPTLISYNNSDGTISTIALNGGANALSGGATLDGAMVYVGGSDNAVHRIDTAAATDAQQISVTFAPNLVAVRPQ